MASGWRNVSAGVGMARRVGISDVAEAAGFSISTVSVALNDVEGARISPQTRDRIRTVAKSLGYVPNRLAQGLRRQRSGIVGFVGDQVSHHAVRGSDDPRRAGNILWRLTR